MVPKELGVKSAKELDGATVCVQPGTTTELNLADYFRANNMKFKPVAIRDARGGRAPRSSPAAATPTPPTPRASTSTRVAKAPNPDDYSSCPRSSPRSRSARWCARATTSGPTSCAGRCSRMLDAEEYGITAQERRRDDEEPTTPTSSACSASTASMGKALGLDDEWAYNIVKQVGNYGESFDRNVGTGSPLKIARGLNALWTKGGLMYAPPIR